MGSFIFKIAIYACLITICLFFISLAVYKNQDLYYSYYEEENIIASLEYYLDNKNEYNTLFIGTSKTYRHIIPNLFDSLSSSKSKSYNLGNKGLFPFRSFEVLDKAIAHSDSLKVLVLELGPPGLIGINYNKKPTIFATDLERTAHVLSMTQKSRLSKRTRVKYAIDYIKAFIHKYLGVGIRYHFEVASGLQSNSSLPKLPKEIAQGNGHLSLDDELYHWKSESLQLRHNDFTKDPSIAGTDIQIVFPNPDYAMDGYTNVLVDYAEQLKDKGITLFFYISPRIHNAQFLYDQKERLSQIAPIIDLSSPENYPIFFSPDYSFDRSHLNEAGARLLTAEFAKQFDHFWQAN